LAGSGEFSESVREFWSVQPSQAFTVLYSVQPQTVDVQTQTNTKRTKVQINTIVHAVIHAGRPFVPQARGYRHKPRVTVESLVEHH
jgi:hypothetical protein